MKTKYTLPVDEPGTFTDELPAAASATAQNEDEFFAGVAERVREFRRGHRTQAFARGSFESVEAMRAATK